MTQLYTMQFYSTHRRGGTLETTKVSVCCLAVSDKRGSKHAQIQRDDEWKWLYNGQCFSLVDVRTYREFRGCLGLAQLEDEISSNLIASFYTNVSFFTLVIVSKRVKLQNGSGWGNALLQFILEQFELCTVQKTFKHSILRTDTICNALFYHHPQPTFLAGLIVFESAPTGHRREQ